MTRNTSSLRLAIRLNASISGSDNFGLLRTAAEVGADYVDAVMRGYREHVQLTDEELDRLPGVLNIRPLWLACYEYRLIVRGGRTPTLDEGWTRWRPDFAERLAAQAIASLRS